MVEHGLGRLGAGLPARRGGRRPGLKVAAVWGDPDDPAALERLERFARAAHTVFAMKREKIGLIGGSYYEVMPASNWHPDVLTSRLGPSYTETRHVAARARAGGGDNAEVNGLVRRLENAGMRVSEGDESLVDIMKCRPACRSPSRSCRSDTGSPG